MKLNTIDLNTLCNIAVTAAKAAGKIIQQYKNIPLDVQIKKGIDSKAAQVVTEVDIMSQKAILDLIEPTCSQYNIGLLTEEKPDDKSRFIHDYFWCIDPLDGTLSFIENKIGYSVSIALVSKTGESIIGVVYEPVESVIYHAINGSELFVNAKPWKTHPAIQNATLSVFHDRSFLKHPQYDYWKANLDKIATEIGCSSLSLIHGGGAVMNAINVLEKQHAIYLKPISAKTGGGSIWDFAATSAIFKAAKAPVSNMMGAPFNLNEIGSTFMNNQGALYCSQPDIFDAMLKRMRNT